MQPYALFIDWFFLIEKNDFGSMKENDEELEIVQKNNLLNYEKNIVVG